MPLDVRLTGLADICKEMGVSPRRLYELCDTATPRKPREVRYRDPLRVQWLFGRPILYRTVAAAWKRRNLLDGKDETKLRGWEDIAAAAETSVAFAKRAAAYADDPLPVLRSGNGYVWAYESAVVEWKHARIVGRSERRRLRAAKAGVKALQAKTDARKTATGDRARRKPVRKKVVKG